MRFIRRFCTKYYFILLFVALEIYAIEQILTKNSFQSAKFFEFSTQMQGKVYEFTSYFSIRHFFEQQNLILQEENMRLRNLLASQPQLMDTIQKCVYLDSISTFSYHLARVISNSITARKNYIILNQGSLDGISEGMSVLSSVGIVGVVDQVSEHYAKVMSVIHLDGKTSAKIKRDGCMGSIVWDGLNYRKVSMTDVPAHFMIQLGDTVVTSGYSFSYPSNIPIGVITQIKKDKSLDFHELDLDLFTDFSNLDYVYVVKNNRKNEIDELQNTMINE